MIYIKDHVLSNEDIDQLRPFVEKQDWNSWYESLHVEISSTHNIVQKVKNTINADFINEDFVGGEAIVEGVQIAPIKGRTYYMDGKMYKHAVLNVIKGARFTLTCWYKKKD